MSEIVVAVVATLVVVALAWVASIFAQYGSFDRFLAARSLGKRYLKDPEFAKKVGALSGPAKPAAPPPPPKPSAEPIRLLALLQRDGRLLDFLLEDIQAYGDEQIGAAVRDIHRNCQKVLKEHLVLEPVLPGQEQSTVEVAAGFDPSAVRLTGNVTGQPPFTGTLQHHGWRAREIKIPKPAQGQDEFVIQPAEVELA